MMRKVSRSPVFWTQIPTDDETPVGEWQVSPTLPDALRTIRERLAVQTGVQMDPATREAYDALIRQIEYEQNTPPGRDTINRMYDRDDGRQST